MKNIVMSMKALGRTVRRTPLILCWSTLITILVLKEKYVDKTEESKNITLFDITKTFLGFFLEEYKANKEEIKNNISYKDSARFTDNLPD